MKGTFQSFEVNRIRTGGRISYNDGPAGHEDVEAVVLAVDARGMTVLFEDRANTNYILFTDPKWMDFICVVE